MSVATLYLRLALGAAFLSAVADRAGLWGPPGGRNVAWGGFEPFLSYTATLNPYVPADWIPALGWAVTGMEVVLGVALVAGVLIRWTGLASGALLLAFALGMTVGTGVKTALDASVFAASAGAFLLAFAPPDRFSVDALRARSAETRSAEARNAEVRSAEGAA